jgi:hypothetical protein
MANAFIPYGLYWSTPFARWQGPSAQGPTGLRSVIELIEELALRGGGVGLFGGCAAGDSGMAVVLRVSI